MPFGRYWDDLPVGVSAVVAGPSRPVLSELAAGLKKNIMYLVRLVTRLTAVGALVLYAGGFTPVGVAAGSLAAMAQSFFYGGFTGGLFSLLQSAGASILSPWWFTTVGTIGAVVTSACIGLFKAVMRVWVWWKGR
ncbi:hypothetical protein C2E23DRAFT_76457 [Lenzites betulinus]|nr:hypothetical protein C2E23DRAFT_76457 [Lenzites betulinus]